MTDLVSGLLLDDSVRFTLTELCSVCAVPEELVVEIVAEGIVDPSGAEPSDWQFSGIAATRILRVVRLQREFEVNLAGAALALDLLEEIERLRRGRSRDLP
jgi:chaperone modulatory protein CbpM